MLVRSADPISKNVRANSSRSTGHRGLSHSSIALSMAVVVGLFRKRVSEIIPDAMQSAIECSGSIPASRYCRATSVHVDPTGSFTKRIGCDDFSPPPSR